MAPQMHPPNTELQYPTPPPRQDFATNSPIGRDYQEQYSAPPHPPPPSDQHQQSQPPPLPHGQYHPGSGGQIHHPPPPPVGHPIMVSPQGQPHTPMRPSLQNLQTQTGSYYPPPPMSYSPMHPTGYGPPPPNRIDGSRKCHLFLSIPSCISAFPSPARRRRYIPSQFDGTRLADLSSFYPSRISSPSSPVSSSSRLI